MRISCENLSGRKWNKFGFAAEPKKVEYAALRGGNEQCNVKEALNEIGIQLRDARKDRIKAILRRPAEVVSADIEFLRKKGLCESGTKKGRERIIAMLSDQNLINGLLKWNTENRNDKRMNTRGLLDM